MPEDSYSTDVEREAYERASVGETRAQLERVCAHPAEQYRVIEVRLEGRYPDTEIRVKLVDLRQGAEREEAYELWRSKRTGEPRFVGYPGSRESPRTVGLLITTWALGG